METIKLESEILGEIAVATEVGAVQTILKENQDGSQNTNIKEAGLKKWDEIMVKKVQELTASNDPAEMKLMAFDRLIREVPPITQKNNHALIMIMRELKGNSKFFDPLG